MSHKFLSFFFIWNEYMIFICLRLIYCIIYEPFCSIIFFHLSGSLIILFFQNCWDLFAKYYSRYLFYFIYGLESFIMKRIFLITGTSNNRIEQDLENTEDAIKCLNQTIRAFLLQSMQHVVLHRNGLIGLSILAIFSAITFFNLSSLQYFPKLMASVWERSS